MAKPKKRFLQRNENKKMEPASLRALAEMAEALTETLPDAENETETETPVTKPEETEETTNQKPLETAETEEVYKILRRLMDDMGAESLSALSAMIDKAEMQKLVRAHGLDENAARLFLAQQEKVRTLREAEEMARREAIYAVMRNEPLYEDVDLHRDAIEALILRTGLSPKEAYNALFAEARISALLEEAEKKALREEKKSRRIPALSGGNAPDSKVGAGLSALESWAADKAGMTKEEYAKYKYSF